MTLLVGNDLIDLRAAHNRGRAGNPRLLARVLTAAERDRLAGEGGGDDGFALLWSAKEAAYKAFRKIRPDLVFAPGRWQVSFDASSAASACINGSVGIDDDSRVAVHWRRTEDWLHCIAVLGVGPADVESEVLALADCPPSSFTERERAGFSRAESAHVRWLAKRLLRQRGFDGIEIVRDQHGTSRLPPRAFAAGVPLAGVDLSLSHDGDYVAAVIALV